MPPALPALCSAGKLVGDDHFFASVPCTKYTDSDIELVQNSLESSGVPKWIGSFDWVVGWKFGWANPARRPVEILCQPDAFAGFMALVENQRFGAGFFESTPLVVGGGDRKLSSQNPRHLATAVSEFRAVFYEGYDLRVPGIGVMPKGLRERYIRGHEEAVREAIHYEGARDLNVVATWGKWYPYLDDLIEDRREAREFARSSSLVEELMLEPADYWRKLSRSSFMMCPEGAGVQTPKMAEAILTGCIPICTPNPAFVELRERGVPIVLVDDWTKIESLDLARTRRALEPAIAEFRKIYASIDAFWEFSFGDSVKSGPG
jgi:hypothetical protein